MSHLFSRIHHAWAARSTRRLPTSLCCVLAVALVIAFGLTPVQASPISGTLSNFDTFYNNTDTPTIDAYGAEIELEDVHASDVHTTYPSHYNTSVKLDVSDLGNGHFGTSIKFDGYNFPGSPGYIAPDPNPTSTNGHQCVGTAGCEHFGFSTSVQPTAMRFFWLDQSGGRIGSAPLMIPNPTWTYVPPAFVGAPPRMRAAVVVPEPIEVEPQLPDSIWMKIFVTEIEREVELDELVSNGDVVPDGQVETETETEWELLEGGVMSEVEDDIPEAGKSIIRRYEFYEYTGDYTGEHEPSPLPWDGTGDPPDNDLGDFIAANMVAVNLAIPGGIPEPATAVLGLMALAMLGVWRRHR